MDLAHPWYYPYATVMTIGSVLMLLLIIRACFGLRRDLAERRADRDARRAQDARLRDGMEVRLRDLLDHPADLGPIDDESRWPR